MNDNSTVRDIGEFGLIKRLDAVLRDTMKEPGRIDLGIGDDAAVWQPAPGMSSVITTDTLVAGNHFRLDWTDWRSLGHKMLAVNLSDIAGMGATPVLATVSLSLTGQERVSHLEELYRGAARLAEPHAVTIAGGDIVRTSGPLTLSVAVIGEARRVLRRSGAQVGDRIAVSGTLGASAAGLKLLESDDMRRDATTADLLITAQIRPNPRISLGRLLADEGATAAMDLSDGLLGDLPKLLESSNVSGQIDAARVPVLPAIRALFPDQWREMALRGGEDYELLVTLPRDREADIVAAAANIRATLTVIGEVIPVNAGTPLMTMTDFEGEPSKITAGAFDHFG